MTEDEMEDVEPEIIQNPFKGVVIQETNGARKIRAAAGGKGKSGGARVVYYYASLAGRIYLFTAYAKNQKADISAKEKKELSVIIRLIERGGYEH